MNESLALILETCRERLEGADIIITEMIDMNDNIYDGLTVRQRDRLSATIEAVRAVIANVADGLDGIVNTLPL